jgi:hypothetical protein
VTESRRRIFLEKIMIQVVVVVVVDYVSIESVLLDLFL